MILIMSYISELSPKFDIECSDVSTPQHQNFGMLLKIVSFNNKKTKAICTDYWFSTTVIINVPVHIKQHYEY
jgi:hypothetical protein